MWVRGGGREKGAQNVWLSNIPIPIRSSNCIGRYNRQFLGPVFVSDDCINYQPFFKFRFFNRQIQILYRPVVSDCLKPIVSLYWCQKILWRFLSLCRTIFLVLNRLYRFNRFCPQKPVYRCGFNQYLFEYCCPPLLIIRVADLHHFHADPDPAFRSNADLDPATHRIDGNLWLLVCRSSRAPLSSIVSIHGTPWLCFKPLNLLYFNFIANPDPQPCL